jgi:hypothetical protein
MSGGAPLLTFNAQYEWNFFHLTIPLSKEDSTSKEILNFSVLNKCFPKALGFFGIYEIYI